MSGTPTAHSMTIAEAFAANVRSRLGHRVSQITLFGSQARGTARDRSDYDTLVVVDRRDRATEDEVLDAAVDMLDGYETLFGPIIYDTAEWARARRSPLGYNILEEGVPL